MRFITTALLAVILAGTAHAQVFVVRHAEKAAQPANDPPLSPEGETRARALLDSLAGAGITAIISTPFARTMGTAKPIASKLGITIETVPVGPEGVDAHAAAVAAAVKKHGGKGVLVIGHSNTVMAIAAALGAPRLPDLCDGDYDQLLKIDLQPSAAPVVARTKYGAPAADPKCGTMK